MSAPDTSALLADETFEGSGSGDRPIWGRRPGEGRETDDDDDEDAGDDHDDTESSGSGMGPIEIGESLKINDVLKSLIKLILTLGVFFRPNVRRQQRNRVQGRGRTAELELNDPSDDAPGIATPVQSSRAWDRLTK